MERDYNEPIVIPISITIPSWWAPHTSNVSAGSRPLPPFRGWPRNSAKASDHKLTLVQSGRGDRPLGLGAEQMLENLQAQAEGRAARIIQRSGMPTIPERVGLKELFGQDVEGAQSLLNRLQKGPVPLPPTVTRETLEIYAKIAETAIAGKSNSTGVQSLRLQALKIMLERMPK